VNVRGLVANGLQQNEINELLDRITVGHLAQLVEIDALPPALKLRERFISPDFPDQVVDRRRRLLGVIAVQGADHIVRRGDAGDHVEAHECLEVVGGLEVVRAGQGDLKRVGLGIVIGGDNAVGLRHLRGDQIDHFLLNVDVRQGDGLHPNLGRQRQIDVGFLDVAHLDQQLAQWAPLLLLQIEGFRDLRPGNLAHLDQDAPQRATPELCDRRHSILCHQTLSATAHRIHPALYEPHGTSQMNNRSLGLTVGLPTLFGQRAIVRVQQSPQSRRDPLIRRRRDPVQSIWPSRGRIDIRGRLACQTLTTRNIRVPHQFVQQKLPQ